VVAVAGVAVAVVAVAVVAAAAAALRRPGAIVRDSADLSETH